MKAKKRSKKRKVDYSLPYEGTTGKSSDREIARRKWESRASKTEKALGSTLSMDSEGNYVRRTKLESKAEYEHGGKVTKGTYDVEVDGRTYQVEGKRTEKRGGRVVKFKAKGRGDGFGIKIKDKKKTNKKGLVKKDRRQSKYTK